MLSAPSDSGGMMVLDSGRYPKGPLKFHAHWWDLLRAKLFGKKYDERIGRYRVVAYYWRGTWYFTRYDAL